MASSELAAILARRRTKDGSTDGTPSIEKSDNVTVSQQVREASSDTNVPRLSIAERIAKMQQQSAATGPAPVPITISTSASRQQELPTLGLENDVKPSNNEEVVPSNDDDNDSGNRRLSDRIQKLQGNMGTKPFLPGGPPGGFRKPSGHNSNSIMSTGDQYENMHSMGIAMPGMGAAIPMPGLAKAGTRIPGMAPSSEPTNENEESTATASLEASHATMSRVTGPKKRGPTRPGPGAFRLPESTCDPSTSVTQTSLGTPLATADTPSLFGIAKPTDSSTTLSDGKVDADSISLSGLSLESAPTTCNVSPTQEPVCKQSSSTLFCLPPQSNSVTAEVQPVQTPGNLLFASKPGDSTRQGDSSDSDWSDDDSSKRSTQPSLFGAAVPFNTTPSVTPLSTASASTSLFGPSESKNEASRQFTAPTPDPTQIPMQRPPSIPVGLFGGNVATPETGKTQYTSLFGGDDDESDDSDIEGGLFGTGLPTSKS